MMPPCTITHMNLDQIADALEAEFSGLGSIRRCKLLGSGFNSIAVETNNGLVFRVGRTSYANYSKEARLLPQLATKVPVPIPSPRWFVESSDMFPHGAIGYEKIDGLTLTHAADPHDQLANDLANFLRALHAFPVVEATSLGVPRARPVASWLAPLRDEAMPVLGDLTTAAEIARIDAWWSEVLGDTELEGYAPALCHYDFWMENLLVDGTGTRLAGVLDFEDALIGDPAQDFATLMDLGEPFVADVERAYVAAGGAFDRGYAHRRRRHWELRPLGGLSYGIRQNDRDEVVDYVAKLRRGPVLSESP